MRAYIWDGARPPKNPYCKNWQAVLESGDEPVYWKNLPRGRAHPYARGPRMLGKNAQTENVGRTAGHSQRDESDGDINDKIFDE